MITKFTFLKVFLLLFIVIATEAVSECQGLQVPVITLSEELLKNVKTGKETKEIEHQLAGIELTVLQNSLSTDPLKKAFWINIYNAYFQLLASRDAKKQSEIYTGKFITIAGVALSLDDIEHGIIRRYRAKWSLGYLPKLSTRSVIRRLAVSKLDYRIHFALNCGAKSCPPIFFYDPKIINKQLDIAAKSFLTSETTVDTIGKIITTSKILQWYKNDFGGKKGTLKIISKIFEQDFVRYELKFAEYDWTQKLQNFSD